MRGVSLHVYYIYFCQEVHPIGHDWPQWAAGEFLYHTDSFYRCSECVLKIPQSCRGKKQYSFSLQYKLLKYDIHISFLWLKCHWPHHLQNISEQQSILE